MRVLTQLMFFITFTTLILAVLGQKQCEDLVADEGSCTKFVRCFGDIRIRFTCPSGTAWEDSLKTCVWTEQIETCQQAKQQRRLDGKYNDTIIYDADENALNNISIGRTFAEARAFGPIATPKQYPCTFCTTGTCGIVVNTIQCICGVYVCQPQPQPTTIQPRNPCASNPCLNGGQCIPSGQGFTCNCPPTFTGNLCEAPAVNPCQPNPCLNGGTCIAQGSSFYCQCPPTHNGYCCQNLITTTTPYNPCAQSPCLNGGTCIPTGNSFYCQCPPTHNGYCCQNLITTTTPYNPCAQSACQNGAICIPTGNSYLCQCPNGYYGSRCENRNYCNPNPCANNGLCTQTTTGYICSCSYPYTGPNCQQIISTTPSTTVSVATRAPCGTNCACIVFPCPTIVVINPCVPNPCQNMGGCAVQNNAARCWCPDGYQGYYCQYQRIRRSLTQTTCNATCLNGGQCYIDELNGGQARCSCPNEYYGSRCQNLNGPKSCQPKNPCMNNGKCITTSAGSQCVCQKGTSGVLCERIHQSTPNANCSLDCQSGGTCVLVGSRPMCHCTPGRTGLFCESQI